MIVGIALTIIRTDLKVKSLAKDGGSVATVGSVLGNTVLERPNRDVYMVNQMPGIVVF